MDEPMKLIDEEKEKLMKSKDENAWYKICDEIKDRRNGQYPNYLSREILELYQQKFPVNLS
tara:strand:+ start:1043 stop:1225 length:183 start_codon:yes stop_codon:yes gene_type:complete